jgi:hypothetical protein
VITTSSGTFTVGQNSPACAWQYGNDRAAQDVAWLNSAAGAINSQSPPVAVPATAAGYPWWLDVETVNSWQSGTSGQAMNIADLQGMIAALQAASVTSGWDLLHGIAVEPGHGGFHCRVAVRDPGLDTRGPQPVGRHLELPPPLLHRGQGGRDAVDGAVYRLRLRLLRPANAAARRRPELTSLLPWSYLE